MTGFLKFLKSKIKLLITFFLIVFIILLAAFFYYQSYLEKKEIEERLHRLELQNAQLNLSPSAQYEKAIQNIQTHNYPEALRILTDLQARYPGWNKYKIDNAISRLKNTVKIIDSENSGLVSFLRNENISAPPPIISDSNIAIETGAIKSDTNVVTGQAAPPPQTAFRKFEYENRKVPLQASVRSHAPNKREKHNVAPVDSTGSMQISLSPGKEGDKAQGFTQYDFEDMRYKKNIKPSVKTKANPKRDKKVYDLKETNTQKINNLKSGQKSGKLEKFEFEDQRYKSDIKPSVKQTPNPKQPSKKESLPTDVQKK